jgi:hypothetical protein
VPDDRIRLNVTLAAAQAEKLSRIAQRTRVPEDTLASSLLSHAIEEADPDAANILAVFDCTPGAWQRIEIGLADARAGRTVPFGESR